MPAALCSVQTTVNEPFLLNLCLNVTFFAVFEWKPLPVTLWGTLPVHDHRTVVPRLTLRLFGVNASPLTPTFLVAPKATADRASAAVRAATTIRETSFLTETPFC